MIYRRFTTTMIITLLWLAVIAGAQSAHADPCSEAALSGGYYHFDSTDARFTHPQSCFQREHAAIGARRKLHATQRSPNTVLSNAIGIGLSGGGIKSSAFQLGLLSGLHAEHSATKAKHSLLKEIDYLASVSGGSWANGAYWSAPESDADFFGCLDQLVSNTTPEQHCAGIEHVLPYKQNKIWGSRKWQEQITDNFLRGQDQRLTDIAHKPNGPLQQRPFPIFMATHANTMIGNKSVKNFPFEITPLSLGTIADCMSQQTPCGIVRRLLRPLHWNNPPEQGFMVNLDRQEDIDILIKKYFTKQRQHGLYLSHAMWSSGALVAKIFSLHLRLGKDGKKLDGVRQKYVLSDGGKADNLGLIPLVERNVKLIILSQIASDAQSTFNDLKRSSGQVQRLFNVTLNTTPLVEPHTGATKNPIITRTCLSTDKTPDTQVWLIKPTQFNIEGFYQYLDKTKKYAGLRADLLANERVADGGEENRLVFPQNSTIAFGYRKELIYAYYVLGKYIAQDQLAPLLNHWLTRGGACS